MTSSAPEGDSRAIWPLVDQQLRAAEDKLAAGQTSVDFQTVGVVCREALISLAQAAHDPTRHATKMADGKTIGDADAEEKLGAYFDAELGGDSSKRARDFAKAAVALANHVVHKRTADFKAGSLAVASMRAVVAVMLILADRRASPVTQKFSEATIRGLEENARQVTNWVYATKKKLSDKQVRLNDGRRAKSMLNSSHNFLDAPPDLPFWPRKDGQYAVIEDLHYFTRKVNSPDVIEAAVLGAHLNELVVLEKALASRAQILATEYGFTPPQ